MRKSERQRWAALAASVASFGLVAAPVLHAELHVRERALARREAVERLFRLAFQRERGAAHAQAMARALEEAFGGGGAPAHEHGAPGGKQGPHQAGSLAHLALAVHAAPARPSLPHPPRGPERPVRVPVAVHPIPRYLVPERSQAPPRA